MSGSTYHPFLLLSLTLCQPSPSSRRYFTQSLPNLLLDTDILTSLVKATDPELHEHMSGLGLELTLLCPQWFLTGFVTGLPWPT